MSDNLIQWLNTEIKLSKKINDIPSDFQNGFLFAELLHRTKVIPNFSIYKNSTNEKEIIHNYCFLTKTFLDLGITLDEKSRNNIMNKSPKTAGIYLYKIKQYLAKHFINYDTLKCKESMILHDIYKKLRFGSKAPTDRFSSLLPKEKADDWDEGNGNILAGNSGDVLKRIKEKYKYLHLDEQNINLLYQSQKEYRDFYNEIHNEIWEVKKKRHEDWRTSEENQRKKWMKSHNNINNCKRKIEKEEIAHWLYYRDGALNYWAESQKLGSKVIDTFNDNWAKWGLDIEVNKNEKQNEILQKKETAISTDIIMMRMKEAMKQKMQAKKDKEKRDRKKLREELELENKMKEMERLNKNMMKIDLGWWNSSKKNKRYITEDKDNHDEEMVKNINFGGKDKHKERVISISKLSDLSGSVNPNISKAHDIVSQNEKVKVDSNINNNNNINIKSDLSDSSEFNILDREALINQQLLLHNRDIKIGDRCSQFKVLLTLLDNKTNNDQSSHENPEEEYYQRNGDAAFNSDWYFKSLENENLEYNLRTFKIRQERHANNKEKISPIFNTILDIAEEVFKYQTEKSVDLIHIDKWNEFMDKFIDDWPIIEIIDTKEEDKSLREDFESDYEERKEEIIDENEINNYCHYWGKWDMQGNIPEEKINGTPMGYVEMYKDIYEEWYRNTRDYVPIEEYEASHEEWELLKMPKGYVWNPGFADIVQTVTNNAFNLDSSHNQPTYTLSKYHCIPIKICLLGPPWSGKQTQAELIKQSYPNIKIINIKKIIDDYIEEYKTIIVPWEENPKYKTMSKKQIEEYTVKQQQNWEEFEPKKQWILPYISRIDNPKGGEIQQKDLDKTQINILWKELSVLFPEESLKELVNSWHDKKDKINDLQEQIEKYKSEERETKKPKTKEIAAAQKEIDKWTPDLYIGFVVVNFLNNHHQVSEFERIMTGYISEWAQQKSEKDKKLYETYANIFDLGVRKNTNNNKLIPSAFDLVLNLSISNTEGDKRYRGIKYDPVAKKVYQVDNLQIDKKILERWVDTIPGWEEENYKALINEYENNIVNINNYYNVLGNPKVNMPAFHTLEYKDGLKPGDIFSYIKTNYIEIIKENYYTISPIGNLSSVNTEENHEPAKKMSESNNNILTINMNMSVGVTGELITPSKRGGQSITRNYDAIYKHLDTFTCIKYIPTLQTFMNFTLRQEKHIIKHIRIMQRNFIAFLNQKSCKSEIANSYINKYNSILDEHPEIRNQPKVHHEWSKNILEVNDKIWEVIETKKNDNINELSRITQREYIDREIGINLIKIRELFILEAERFWNTIEVLKKYYFKEQIEDNLLTCNPSETLSKELNMWSASFRSIIDKLYQNSLTLIIRQHLKTMDYIQRNRTHLHQAQSQNDTVSVMSSRAALRKKTSSNIQLGFNINAETRNKTEEDLKGIIQTEIWKYKLRLWLLKYYSLKSCENWNIIWEDISAIMDNWIIWSVTHQNNALNNWIEYWKIKWTSFTSNISLEDSEIELDSFDVFKEFDISSFFNNKSKTTENAEENRLKSWNYSNKDLMDIYYHINDYKLTEIPYWVNYDIVYIEVFLRFVIKSENKGICRKLKELNIGDYRKVLDLFTESVEIDIDMTEDDSKNAVFNKYINIKKLFTSLLWLGSKVVFSQDIETMLSDAELLGKEIITKEEFDAIVFWFEDEEFLLCEGNSKELLKNSWYEINKIVGKEEINIKELFDFLCNLHQVKNNKESVSKGVYNDTTYFEI